MIVRQVSEDTRGLDDALVENMTRKDLDVVEEAKGFQRLLCAQTGPRFQVRDPLFSTHFGVFHEAAAAWTHTAGAADAAAAAPESD